MTLLNIRSEPGRRSVAVSHWFKDALGRSRGFSPAQVDKYLRVARATPAQRAAMAEAETLHAAIAMLITGHEQDPIDDREPTAKELQAVNAFASSVEALTELEDITAATKEMIRGLLKGCQRICR